MYIQRQTGVVGIASIYSYPVYYFTCSRAAFQFEKGTEKNHFFYHDSLTGSCTPNQNWALGQHVSQTIHGFLDKYCKHPKAKQTRWAQLAINSLRVKAKTSRIVIDKNYTCAYCDHDITCQCIHDLTECPRTKVLRQQFLEHLKPDQHVNDKHTL